MSRNTSTTTFTDVYTDAKFHAASDDSSYDTQPSVSSEPDLPMETQSCPDPAPLDDLPEPLDTIPDPLDNIPAPFCPG